jgi:hypothetical protein
MRTNLLFVSVLLFIGVAVAASANSPPQRAGRLTQDRQRPDVRPFKARRYDDLSPRLRGQLDKMTVAAQQKALDELSRLSLDPDDNGKRFHVHESGDIYVADDGILEQPREQLSAAMFRRSQTRRRRMISGTSPTGYSLSGNDIISSFFLLERTLAQEPRNLWDFLS